MEPITNADRLLLILRQRLAERSKSRAVQRGQASTSGQSATGLENVIALAAAEGADDRQLSRALVQSILADQFGGQLINEAKFQQVVERVAETLDTDPVTRQLLAKLVQEIRDKA